MKSNKKISTNNNTCTFAEFSSFAVHIVIEVVKYSYSTAPEINTKKREEVVNGSHSALLLLHASMWTLKCTDRLFISQEGAVNLSAQRQTKVLNPSPTETFSGNKTIFWFVCYSCGASCYANTTRYKILNFCPFRYCSVTPVSSPWMSMLHN